MYVKGLSYHHTSIIFTPKVSLKKYQQTARLEHLYIYGNYTGIIAYADDIVLLSATLSALQSLVSKCETYGTTNYIKLNAGKTEFITSGKHQIKNHFIDVSNTKINFLTKFKHLGFIWDTEHTRSKRASLQHCNVNERISQFQTVAKTLIRAGIRFCHPNTIVHLYNSLTVPKLIYGLELCELSTAFLHRMDVIGRAVLKSFFNISKFSKNYLHIHYLTLTIFLSF